MSASVTQSAYGVSVTLDAMVPMRDGVRLAADVYRPAVNGDALVGPSPTLLLRTPYDKRDPIGRRQNGEHWARQGYVSVIQDCRGCYASEGELSFLRQEAEDGYDTMAWLTQQPWCNGKIGTHGYSYMAWVQSALANLNAPGLTAMWPSMGGSHAYTSTVRHGGAFEVRFLCWAFWHAALNTNRTLKPDQAAVDRLNGMDIREQLRCLIREPEAVLRGLPAPYQAWLRDVFTSADYSDYWSHPALGLSEHWEEHADVPVYVTGGWYDSYTRAAFENFVGLSQRKRGPVKLLMGPWVHGDVTMEQSWAGDVAFGPAAALTSFQEVQRQWFDHCLKGIETGIEAEPPLKLFIMGGGDGHRTPEGRLFHGGRWRAEQDWPLAHTRFTEFFLQPDGGLGLQPPTSADACTHYAFDPENPVPTVGGNISSLHALRPWPLTGAELTLIPRVLRVEPICPGGAFDQRDAEGRPLAERPDVLVFQTEPLAEPTEVTGPIEVRLFVGSSAPDTDFTAKLIDVYPPNADYPEGYALNLSDSLMRARYRESWSEPELLRTGVVYELTITLYPTGNVFGQGHRIRLDISSSNYPRFDVNPNTGEPIGRHARVQIATNTVHHSARYPSRIVLPVITAL